MRRRGASSGRDNGEDEPVSLPKFKEVFLWPIVKTAIAGAIPLVGFMLGFYRSLVLQSDLDPIKAELQTVKQCAMTATATIEKEATVRDLVSKDAQALQGKLDTVSARLTRLGDSVQFMLGRLEAISARRPVQPTLGTPLGSDE